MPPSTRRSRPTRCATLSPSSASIRGAARLRRSARWCAPKLRIGPRSSRTPVSRSIHDKFRLPGDAARDRRADPELGPFRPLHAGEAGEQKFLIDAGPGATIRLHQLKIPIGRIDVQLLTHYHSDHTSGIPDVWLTGWLQSYLGTRKTPYRVIGPTGARTLMENLERAYAL